MFKNSTVIDVLEQYKSIWALEHVGSLFDWDTETYMPFQASKARGFAEAQVALMKQERMIRLAPLISRAEKLSDLSDYEKGILRVIQRDLDYYTKLPPKLLEELHRTTTEATVVWREARRKSDYLMFKNYLEKIVDLKRQETEALGYKGHPYNALLDRYEEGATTDDVDTIFSGLVSGLKKILGKILSEKKFPRTHPLESSEYQQEDMRRVNQEILTLLQMPEKTFRMDTSTHPFTAGMAIEDVRVTTRYEGKDFKNSMYSVIHECGHAIYDLQIDTSLEFTPLSRTDLYSFGVHESQSRFWENFIGRSREFTKLVYPILKKHLSFVSGYSEDEIYRYLNIVGPSLIRVEADEVTYNFHTMIRYELEKKLIGGDLSVSELPTSWEQMMEKNLGVRPKNYSEGVLQDVHWSAGLIGYFATYTLGNVMGGMVFDRIQKDIDLADSVGRGEFGKIKEWLKEHIHSWGSTYSPKELQQKIFGQTYNPEHLLSYLEQKYLK